MAARPLGDAAIDAEWDRLHGRTTCSWNRNISSTRTLTR